MSSIRSGHMKVICPTAPTMPVTLNAGFRMPSWFDLRGLDDKTPEDAAGIKSARDSIHSMIAEEERAGIPAARIVLGGFSQGGALALYSAFSYPRRLGGVLALSCWLPLRAEFPAAATENKSVPILQCHGDCDPLVPYKWGQMTTQAIRKFAPQIEFKTYSGMMHSSCDQEVADMKTFVEKHVPAQ